MGGFKINPFYLLGGISNVTYMGEVPAESINSPMLNTGIYYGHYSGDIGLGSGFGTFLTICGLVKNNGWYTRCLQIAFEHYSGKIGMRFSYDQSHYYGWKV